MDYQASTFGSLDVSDKCVSSVTAALADATTIFTITGGPIEIIDLLSECITAQGASATTLQWTSTPTVGTATTFSGACSTLSAVAAGTSIRLAPTALSTALVISLAAAGGVHLGTNVANKILVRAGTITSTVANATTGTWKHYLRYRPLAKGVTVT
jgi:hypothetical protein